MITRFVVEARPDFVGRLSRAVVDSIARRTSGASAPSDPEQFERLSEALMQAMAQVGSDGRGAGGAAGFFSYIAVHETSTFARHLGDQMELQHWEAVDALNAEAAVGTDLWETGALQSGVLGRRRFPRGMRLRPY